MKKAVIIFCLLLSGLLVYNKTLTQQISDQLIPNLNFAGKNYSIIYGQVKPIDKNYLKVINLVQFYKSIKEDPLFAPPNLNVNLSHSLSLLKQTEERVLKTNKYEQPVFPIDFLLNVVNVSTLTKSFLQNPSDKSAKDLISLYEQTSQDYQKDLQQLIFSIDKSEKDKYLEKPYVYINIAIYPETVSKDLSIFQSNSVKLIHLVKKKESCMLYGIKCTGTKIINLIPTSQTQTAIPKSLDTRILFGEDYPKQLTRGPFAVYSNCWGFGENYKKPLHFFYLINLDTRYPIKPGLKSEHSKLIDQSYFRKLSPKVPADKSLLDQGLIWQHQRETNTYMCPDLTYQPTLSTIDYLITHKINLFKNIHELNIQIPDLGEFPRVGLIVEQDFYKYPNQDNLEQLAVHYWNIYQKIGRVLSEHRSQLSQPWFSSLSKFRDDFLDHYLLIKSKMANFDLLLNNLNQDFLSMEIRSIIADYRYDSYYIYALRSAYSLTYLPFSDLVWKTEEIPDYIQKKRVINAVGEEFNYMTYEQAKNKFSDQEIASWYPKQEINLYQQYLEKLQK